MKKTTYILLVIFGFSHFFGYSQDIPKVSKLAKKESKKLIKDGWESNRGSEIELQLDTDEYFKARYKKKDGKSVNLIGFGTFKSDSKGQAYQYARDLAKQDIAGQIETEIRAVTEIDQVNDDVAKSLNDALITTTALVKQKISGDPVRSIVKTTNLGGNNYEYELQVLFAYDYNTAAELHLQLMRNELNREKAKEVREKYEDFLMDGLYDKVQDNITKKSEDE